MPSSTAHTTWSARVRGRRGRSHSTCCRSDGTPVPDASTVPGSRPLSTPRVSSAGLHLVDAGELGDQRVPGLARGVAGADQAGQPGALQPRGRQREPALGGRQRRPGVEGVGRDPARVAVGSGRGGQQPCGRGDLDQQRGGRLVDVQLGRPGRAGRGRRGRRCAGPRAGCSAPLVEQQLHPVHRLEGRAGGGPVDHGLARSEVASAGGASTAAAVVWPPRSAIPTSPGSTTEPPLRGTSSRCASSSSAGVRRLPGQHGVPGGAAGRRAAGVEDVLEQSPGPPARWRRAGRDLVRRSAGRPRPGAAR